MLILIGDTSCNGMSCSDGLSSFRVCLDIADVDTIRAVADRVADWELPVYEVVIFDYGVSYYGCAPDCIDDSTKEVAVDLPQLHIGDGWFQWSALPHHGDELERVSTERFPLHTLKFWPGIYTIDDIQQQEAA